MISDNALKLAGMTKDEAIDSLDKALSQLLMKYAELQLENDSLKRKLAKEKGD